MRVARSAPDEIEIRGRDAMRASLLLGVALTLSVALVLVSLAGALAPAQITAWSFVGLVGAVIAFFAWPRRHRISLRRGEHLVVVDGSSEPLGDARLRLVAVRREGAPGPRTYGVVLERSAKAPLIVLSDPKPDRVLRDLTLLRKVVSLPTFPGWGLPRDAPWTTQAEPAAAVPASAAPVSRPGGNRFASRAPRGRTKKSMAGTLFVGSAGMAAIIVVNLTHRIALGDAPSAMSLVLPILSVSTAVLVALGIWTSRTSLELGPGVRFARFVYGIAIERRSVEKGTIHSGYLVSPEGSTPRHLLLDTRSGPMAFPCAPEAGPELLGALYGGGPEISKAPPVQLRE
jgi:hypothetical protein